MKTCTLLAVLLLNFEWLCSGQAFRLKSAALPIQPESEPQPSKGMSGCSFGGKFYAPEDTWHPDLGEPFGVMHCVVCHCESQRNHRGKVFGKVSCKNIKHDCPEPPCSNPVLLPGHCCRSCPKAHSHALDKKVDHIFDGFEYFQEKDDELHKTYNDRSYLSSEDISQDDSRTDFVALLTAAADSRTTTSSGVARARFTLSRSSLVFSITFKRIGHPSRVKFIDRDGNIVFEYFVPRTASPESNMICGIWSNLQKSHIRLLKSEQLHVTMLTTANQGEEIHGKLIKHRALFAETFSSIITSDAEHAGMGGIAMLTLSDVENNLHFILMFEGLLERREKERSIVPIRVELLYHRHVLREIRANVTSHDPDFAEVLTNLNNREMFWLSRGQLEIAVATEGKNPRRISGYITGKKSCDTIQSVLSSGDALTPTKTGAVGSATLTLHDNGTLEYQIQVAGVASKVTGVTIETKPRRRSRRNVLFDMTADYSEGRVVGTWERLNARDIHMLLQNELFLNVATSEYEEGELRGQISSLLYSGLQARLQELPVPLAGQFVSPPVRTSAAGHVWVSVDENCHLHYEIVVSGLRKSDDVTLNAHLHGFAEIGELHDSSREHKRLLKGFYGSQAEGVLKDLSMELLRHLDKGTAFIQVSTKVNPRGEIRGRVHVPNSCESGPASRIDDAHFDLTSFEEVKLDPEEIKKDPSSCFFEGQFRAHGSHWAPDYDKKCTVCTCQKRTVICDPIICPVLDCANVVHLEDKCCPVCEERKQEKGVKQTGKSGDQMEGCYFEGDRKIHPPGTTWHPFVPPFGYIKCAVCTCRAATGEVHCEKVNCPRLTCSNPVRRSPSDCCKECPAEEKAPIDLAEMMQADGPQACKFGKNWYLNNESWHPEVPPFGEMKCITCWCDDGVTKCQREQCPLLTCSKIARRENKCCPECKADAYNVDEVEQLKEEEEKKQNWGY
ncbi:chordin-like [Acipenser oxyrinchus oxyrinchus]|uniref:Chordin n=1 Tax=Acipenser oxyrinchus oxyrinchus TaxID=40147 RepID=A0AAD8D364_ACIOX|nr:chordin-like [Acipenser oxyrinchus oxyrinchus]